MSRNTLLKLEEDGLLHPTRLRKGGYRRYLRTEVLALVASTQSSAVAADSTEHKSEGAVPRPSVASGAEDGPEPSSALPTVPAAS